MLRKQTAEELAANERAAKTNQENFQKTPRYFIWKKIDEYLEKDNPLENSERNKSVINKIGEFFTSTGEEGRKRAVKFKMDHHDKNGKELVITAYDFVVSSEGVKLRNRIGEALCQYFEISDQEALQHRVSISTLAAHTGGAMSESMLTTTIYSTMLQARVERLKEEKRQPHPL